MADDNQTLGRFELVGIPPAPRGVPQIDVGFDIDADGILDVSAKDLGTGAEQQIRVTASGGLSKDEVEELVEHAATHAEADSERRDFVELTNTGEGLVYSVVQTLEIYDEQLAETERQEVTEALDRARAALADRAAKDIHELRDAVEDLQQLAYRMTEAIYERVGEGAAPPRADQVEELMDDLESDGLIEE